MILPSIGHLATRFGHDVLRWLPCPIGDGACGCLAILMPRLADADHAATVRACVTNYETCLQR